MENTQTKVSPVNRALNFLPFGRYPPLHPVSSRRLLYVLLILSILIYIGLTTFNILTQGFTPNLISSLQPKYYFENHDGAGKRLTPQEEKVMKRLGLDGGTKCQPSRIGVGGSVFTEQKGGNFSEVGDGKGGDFQWTLAGVVEAVDGDGNRLLDDDDGGDGDKKKDDDDLENLAGKVDTAFNYKGGNLSCNVTQVGLTYYWSEQSFVYGLCANCTSPSVLSSSSVSSPDGTPSSSSRSPSKTRRRLRRRVTRFVKRQFQKLRLTKRAINTGSVAGGVDEGETSTSLVSFCANYDLSMSNWPTWTEKAQDDIQAMIMGLGGYFQQLNFPNGTFQPSNWAGESTPSNQTITPRDVLSLNVYLDNIRYSPKLLSNDDFSPGSPQFGKNHSVYITTPLSLPPNQNPPEGAKRFSETPTNLNDAFQRSLRGGAFSNLQLAIAGIGGLHLGEDNRVGSEPDVVGQLRITTLSVLNRLVERGLRDLNGKEISGMYLCQKEGKKWKNPVTVFAVVIGNNASLFGVFLIVAAVFAEWWDRRYRTPSSGPAPPERATWDDLVQVKNFPPSGTRPINEKDPNISSSEAIKMRSMQLETNDEPDLRRSESPSGEASAGHGIGRAGVGGTIRRGISQLSRSLSSHPFGGDRRFSPQDGDADGLVVNAAILSGTSASDGIRENHSISRGESDSIRDGGMGVDDVGNHATFLPYLSYQNEQSLSSQPSPDLDSRQASSPALLVASPDLDDNDDLAVEIHTNRQSNFDVSNPSVVRRLSPLRQISDMSASSLGLSATANAGDVDEGASDVGPIPEFTPTKRTRTLRRKASASTPGVLSNSEDESILGVSGWFNSTPGGSLRSRPTVGTRSRDSWDGDSSSITPTSSAAGSYPLSRTSTRRAAGHELDDEDRLPSPGTAPPIPPLPTLKGPVIRWKEDMDPPRGK